MPGPRRRGRASLSVPPGPCRRAAESRRPPPCPRPAADLKVRGTITSPVPPRNRSTSHRDDRPRTSRHDRQTLPDPPRTGTSTYPPNMNLPLSHPSELHPQKNGRKARPRRNARAARPAPPNTAHPARRAGQALQRHGGPCRPDASRAPRARPIRTPHVEIDIPVRDRRRHRQPHPTMSISTGRAPARAPTDTAQRTTRPSAHRRRTGPARPASTAEPRNTAHHQPGITHLEGREARGSRGPCGCRPGRPRRSSPQRSRRAGGRRSGSGRGSRSRPGSGAASRRSAGRAR